MSLRDLTGLRGTEFVQVSAAAFAYLFHKINQSQYHQHIGDKTLSSRVIKSIKKEGYALKNCKLYAYAYWLHRLGMREKPSATLFEVERDDALFLRRLNLEHLDENVFAAYSLSEFDSILVEVLESSSMSNHIGKLISKKMIFLVRSYGINREELVSHLKAAAIYALYMQYPRFQSRLHLENTAKTAIHNTAMTCITYNTSAIRQKLFKNEEGEFQAVHEDIALRGNTIEAPNQYMFHVKDDLEALAKLTPRFKPETQKFLTLASGQYDVGFSTFLKKDNRDVAESLSYDKYIEKVRKYCGLSEDRVQQIFVRLRSKLS